MHQRRRADLAITAAVITAVLWQVTGEIAARLIDAGQVPPSWLPIGSTFTLNRLLGVVPNGGLWLVGMLLSFVLVGALVGLGVRLVMRPGFDGVRSFLAIWMVVVLAAVVADAVTQPIAASYGGEMVALRSVLRGAHWGVLGGWVIAGVVGLGSRGRRP